MMKNFTKIAFALLVVVTATLSASAQTSYSFTTGSATNITQTSATISGYSSGAVTQTWVEITANGSVQRFGQINGAGSVSGNVTGLRCGYTYSYQAAGMVGNTMTNGAYRQFSTLPCDVVVQNVAITSFSASPSYLSAPGNTTLSWTSTNASSCGLAETNQQPGISSVNGTVSRYVSSTQTFTLKCIGTNGSTDSRSVTVQVVPVVQNNVRIINFNASPTSVYSGGFSRLSWVSESATSCAISGAQVATTGSRDEGPFYSTETFTLSCVGANGSSDFKTATITVQSPVVQNVAITSFSTSPSYLSAPGNTTLSWTSTNASTCNISGIGSVNVSGSRSQYVGSTQSFTLTCNGTNGGSDSRTVTVQVVPVQQTGTFTTGSATNITQTSATISGYSSGAVTQTWVEITANGSVQRFGQINGAGSVSGNVTGLRCGYTYSYQAAGMVGNTMTNGAYRQFSTLPCDVVVQNPRVINFTASPSYLSNPGNTTLSWSSENTSSCSISGIGSVGVSGSRSQYVGSTQSFTLTCNGTNGGSDSRTVTVQVNQVVNNFQINSFTASPSYLSNPGNTTLSWSTTNASTCNISGVGSVNVDGSQSRYVSSTQTFTLSCVGTNGGSDSRTVTVTVDQVQNNFQINSFTASPSYLSNPGNATLVWSTTNASTCNISGIGSVNVSGSQSRYISSTQSFTLSCVGTNGGSDSRTVTVQVDTVTTNPVRIDSFYASPTTVANGGYSTLYWTATNASYCTVNGSSVSTSGSRSVGPFYGSQNYTLICNGVNGGSDSRTVFITTSGQTESPTINSFYVANTGDGYVNISWSSNADYCIAGGDWSGTKVASGSERVGPFSGTRTFTLTCYRNNQTTSQTQTIFVSGTQTQNNAAITNIATRIGTSGAQLNGIAIISNNQLSEGWFEYGRTESLGNVTNSRSIGSARTTDFSTVVTGLSANTVYYYRAVMRNSQGTFRGDIERFVTARVAVVVNPTPINPGPVTPTQTALTYSRPAFMEITVNQVTLDAVREGEVEYQVNYRSLTNRTLINTAVKVLLPEEYEYISATRGVYSAENKTLTLNIGEFRAGEQGTIIVRARVLPNAQIGKTVVVTGYANYTIPADAQFIAYQDEVVAYALTTIREARFVTSNTNGVAAIGFFGSDLGMVFGWLLLLLILLAIIYMLRKLYLSFVEAKKA